MTVTYADGPRDQNNFGGTFVGRDNYGTIETLDPNTKAILAKLAREAPPLAALVSQALRDGIVSPQVVYALERAAWSINEDVASALRYASDRINEDVASSLSNVGEKINPEVASSFSRTAESLDDAISELDRIARSLTSYDTIGRLDAIVGRLSDEAGHIEYMFTPPQPIRVLSWDQIKAVFLVGCILGAGIAAAIAYAIAH